MAGNATVAAKEFLSGRGKAALGRHQREVLTRLRDVQGSDRVLSGALAACDALTQRETVEAYLESVQELRVALQRLEGFLLQRLTRPNDHELPDHVEHTEDFAAGAARGVPMERAE